MKVVMNEMQNEKKKKSITFLGKIIQFINKGETS